MFLSVDGGVCLHTAAEVHTEKKNVSVELKIYG